MLLNVFSFLHTWNDLNALSSSQATSVLILSFGNILHLHRNHHGTEKSWSVANNWAYDEALVCFLHVSASRAVAYNARTRKRAGYSF